MTPVHTNGIHAQTRRKVAKGVTMPSIIDMPVQSNSRSIKAEDVQTYADLLGEVTVGQAVLVDDSASPRQDRTYARGERIRLALHKFDLMDKANVQVRTFKNDAGEFVAALARKA